ncbi:MAG TPA: hypothetical protein VHW25_06880, partial [Steroidobacteraceae bacterium]|nr:hypothetical protein [Steroidobacteraceae bacterium]
SRGRLDAQSRVSETSSSLVLQNIGKVQRGFSVLADHFVRSASKFDSEIGFQHSLCCRNY